MKFLITITKDVIDRSLMCGTPEQKGISIENCAFAVAYNQLVPVHVWSAITFRKKERGDLKTIPLTKKQDRFIKEFDSMRNEPMKRYSLVGRTFEVEIPDSVIEYWYGDSVKAAQKIINNPILQTVNI